MAECAPEAPSPGLAVEEAPGTAPWPGCSRSAESPLHSVPGCTSLGPVVLEAGGVCVGERMDQRLCALIRRPTSAPQVAEGSWCVLEIPRVLIR